MGRRGGWGKLQMIAGGVEISIAGGGGEMVRVRSLDMFFIFFIFFTFFIFLNHVFVVKVQELACIVRYGVKKTLIPTTARFTSSWEKSNTPNP